AYMGVLRAQTEEFCANLFHVFPDFAFFFRRTQQVGRMESRNHAHSVEVEKLPAQPRDRRGRLKHRLRSESAKAADDLWTDGRELPFHKGITGGDFIRFRIAIVRRPALEDIADVDVVALEIDGFDDLRQQLAGAADKG